MIGWLGPAVLLLLLASAPQHRPEVGPGSVAVVLAEEFAAVASPSVRLPETERPRQPRCAAGGEVRALPRRRSIPEAGLPAPRAP